MEKKREKHAVTPHYESPFEKELNLWNRWVVVLARLIPWDGICNLYQKQVGISCTVRANASKRQAENLAG
ncbi:hypothetical protein FACS189435_3070 [Bacteroidia bacterium]|nr:hypothetical protein FACS189435_3070 [Bacteroidia bacterium]